MDKPGGGHKNAHWIKSVRVTQMYMQRFLLWSFQGAPGLPFLTTLGPFFEASKALSLKLPRSSGPLLSLLHSSLTLPAWALSLKLPRSSGPFLFLLLSSLTFLAWALYLMLPRSPGPFLSLLLSSLTVVICLLGVIFLLYFNCLLVYFLSMACLSLRYILMQLHAKRGAQGLSLHVQYNVWCHDLLFTFITPQHFPICSESGLHPKSWSLERPLYSDCWRMMGAIYFCSSFWSVWQGLLFWGDERHCVRKGSEKVYLLCEVAWYLQYKWLQFGSARLSI